MDLNFFKQTRILDGGMGQELLARGMEPQKTLWSTTALLDEKLNYMIRDIHLDFIKAGAEVIVTSTFTARRQRMIDNGIEHQFEFVNKRAGELAKEAKELSGGKALIAGGLPPQNLTYQADLGDDLDFIRNAFHDQAECLNPYCDFFYLDVLNSQLECQLAMEAIAEYNKPFLIGVHIRKSGLLPSGERITDAIAKLDTTHCLGVLAGCVAPEIAELVTPELKATNLPFGFKANAFKEIPEDWKLDPQKPQPKDTLGGRTDLTPEKLFEFAQRMHEAGATIIGGCCETRPAHIAALSRLKP